MWIDGDSSEAERDPPDRVKEYSTLRLKEMDGDAGKKALGGQGAGDRREIELEIRKTG